MTKATTRGSCRRQGQAGMSSASRPPAASSRLGGILAGVRLCTPDGYRPVETLQRGDNVATLIGQEPMFAKIVRVGRRHVKLAADDRARIAPIRIRRHAIADSMPNRDILLAPDHAIYLDGSLYPAGWLVNRGSILCETNMRVAEYWGIWLERHNIVAAENLAIESLLTESLPAYSEVASPHLSLVGGIAALKDSADDPELSNFPARIPMSVRWFRRRLLARWQAMPDAPLAVGQVEPHPPQNSQVAAGVDVEAEAHAVLRSLTGIAAERRVRLELALQPHLIVSIDPATFREVLAALLTHSIHAATNSRVLLGAMGHAGWVQVAVVDEGISADQLTQEADLAPARQLALLQGGTVEVDCRSGEGTTVLLRLPGSWRRP